MFGEYIHFWTINIEIELIWDVWKTMQTGGKLQLEYGCVLSFWLKQFIKYQINTV